MFKKYNVIEKYCKCNANRNPVYSIFPPIKINDISNANISGGGCSATDVSYGSIGTNELKEAKFTLSQGAAWYSSNIPEDISFVRGINMTRDGIYSVFFSDRQILYSSNYGQNYAIIGVIDDPSMNKSYVNETGEYIITTSQNALYISYYTNNVLQTYMVLSGQETNSIAASDDFKQIWCPTNGGTYFFKYDSSVNVTLFEQLKNTSNWKKTTNTTLQSLNGRAADSSSDGRVFIIGAKTIKNGLFISQDYGSTFTNIQSSLEVYDSNILCGDVSVSGDGNKLIISVYQNPLYPIYIVTVNSYDVYKVVKYSVNVAVDALSCGNSLVIYNAYDDEIGPLSAESYYSNFTNTVKQQVPVPVEVPTTNTSYNTVQQSCKMAYSQSIQAQFKPSESTTVTGGNPYGSATFALNSENCKKYFNNYAGMPSPPVLSGASTFASNNYATFTINTQANITASQITIYYYDQIINGDLYITGSNGVFQATFQILLDLGTYNIYSTCKNNTGRKSMPSSSYTFTIEV